SGGVSTSGLSIGDYPAFSKAPFLQAQSLGVHVEMMPLIFSRKLNITGITIEQQTISAVETLAGVFNFSSIGGCQKAAVASQPVDATGQAVDLSIGLLRISDGRLTFEKTGSSGKPLVLDKLNIEMKDFAASAKFPITMSAGLPNGGTIQ